MFPLESIPNYTLFIYLPLWYSYWRLSFCVINSGSLLSFAVAVLGVECFFPAVSACFIFHGSNDKNPEGQGVLLLSTLLFHVDMEGVCMYLISFMYHCGLATTFCVEIAFFVVILKVSNRLPQISKINIDLTKFNELRSKIIWLRLLCLTSTSQRKGDPWILSNLEDCRRCILYSI